MWDQILMCNQTKIGWDMGISKKSEMAAKNPRQSPEWTDLSLSFEWEANQTLINFDTTILWKIKHWRLHGARVDGQVVTMDHNNATLWPYLAS